MNPCKSRLRLWSSRLGRGFLACLLAMMFIPFMGTGKVAHAASPIWTSVGSSPGSVVSLQNVNGTLYAGTENGSNDVWSYSNGTWTQMIGSPSSVYSLLDVNGTLYAGTYPENGSNDVWTYSNGTWTQMIGSPSNVASLLDVNGTLYAGVGTYGGSNDVWTYSNGTWTQMIGSPSSVHSLQNVNGTLYAGTYGGSNDVWTYSNGAWTQMIGSPSSVYSLLDVNGTLYAGTWTGSNNNVWSYSNGTWTQMIGSPSSVYSLLDVNGTLYAGTVNGSNCVWTYSNGTWTQMSGSPSTVLSLVDVNGTLYAGAYDSGVQQLIFPVGAPANLQASSTTSASTALSWDAVSGATGYNIYENGGNTAIATVTSATYTVSGLTPDTSYTFTVSAFNAAGESAQSGEINVLTALSAPTGLTATAGNGQVALTWSPIPGTVTYSVYEGMASGSYGTTPVATVAGSTNSFTATGLTNGTTYYFAVTAINAGGSSGYSNEASATPEPNLSVIYNGNGATSGTVPIDSSTYTPGVTVAVYGNTGNLLKTGYTFAGWNTQADGSGTNYIAGDTFSMGTTNVTLYAKWTANSTGGSSGGGGAAATTTSDKVTATDGKLTLPVGKSGEVSLKNEVTVSIPTGATDKELKLTIEKVLETQKLLTNKEVLASPVFEMLKNFSENFSKPVTLTFAFDPASLKGDQKASVFYYDEAKKEWVEVGGKVNGDHITVEVNHFTKYAVFAVGQDGSTKTPSTDTKQTLNLSDISGHWAEAGIKQAVSSGIVSGYQDGTFKPNQTVTRAEFAVMLMNTLKPQGEAAALTFTDAAKIGAWAQKAVAQAVQAGIINGYADGTFHPNAEITRSEMATMIANALKLSIESDSTTDFADDKDIPSWAKGAVAALKKLSLMSGTGANQFNPNARATRAEAVTVLLKMLAQVEQVN